VPPAPGPKIDYRSVARLNGHGRVEEQKTLSQGAAASTRCDRGIVWPGSVKRAGPGGRSLCGFWREHKYFQPREEPVSLLSTTLRCTLGGELEVQRRRRPLKRKISRGRANRQAVRRVARVLPRAVVAWDLLARCSETAGQSDQGVSRELIQGAA